MALPRNSEAYLEWHEPSGDPSSKSDATIHPSASRGALPLSRHARECHKPNIRSKRRLLAARPSRHGPSDSGRLRLVIDTLLRPFGTTPGQAYSKQPGKLRPAL